MTDVLHSGLTGADLHEPKGVASATNGQVYVANGAGSGVWKDRVQMGFLDYNDDATSTTPITVTGGAGYVALTNDGAGAFTNKTYAPDGVTDIWNVSTNRFDWSDIALGDIVDIRLDVSVIIATTNTEVDIALELAEGSGSNYAVPFINPINFKTTGTKKLVVYNGIYMGDSNTLDNPAFFKIQADKTCTITVNGWYCKIIKR